MRTGLVLIGGLLLLAGIVLEGFYFANSQFTFSGTVIHENTYLVTGLIFMVLGLGFSWIGLKIPKVQAVRT